MAGPSSARWGVATVIVRSGPALGHRGPAQDPQTWLHEIERPLKSSLMKSRKVQLLSLRAPFLDRPDREEEMQVIVGEWNEAVLCVELPGVGIDGQDFDCKQAE